MAWTPGADVLVGDLITAATWNSYMGAAGSLDWLKDNTYISAPVTVSLSNGAFAPIELNANGVNFADLNLANDYGAMGFRCPPGFNAITSAVVVVRPDMTHANAAWTILNYMTALGEAAPSHLEQDAVSTYNVVLDTLFEVDVSGQLTNLAVGDWATVTLLLRDAAHDVDVVGFFMVYT